jgi:hypothetical protein
MIRLSLAPGLVRPVPAVFSGDNWQHRCTVAPQRTDSLETLGIIPVGPLPCWGWGDIPDQYGRRRDGNDGRSPMPEAVRTSRWPFCAVETQQANARYRPRRCAGNTHIAEFATLPGPITLCS